ncbi:hypothetical protein CAP36_05850 [Chitinophagaceae bacterium IBVUCB2]|nr:hypothetical protein CAP36_05850 [Chitinophagaceae bacterium IBVUCB2]
MRLKLLGLIVLISYFTFLPGNLSAQSFSFNCTRDTIIAGCDPVPCFTLKGIIPDLKGLSTTYNINPSSTVSGCAPVYVQPNDPAGTPTNLTVDDTYSSVINIGFPFTFFGATYNSLIASTNGLVSFDVSKAGGFAHFAVPGDLPSASYDRAIIMGPYHDLDPSIGSSPTQRIQYQNFGIAPHRRWVFSFFKVPLYSTSGICDPLIENTHQIILYESTGIVEVTVFSKQICTAWQAGKAMIGMQDFNRTQFIMAPNRRVSDAPWGSVGMNESWRFVPASGPSLFKRVELTDIAGTIITTGTVVNIGNGRLEASFPNICPPAGATTSYIIRSVYQKIDDPSVEIFGTDTVRVTKGPPTDLNATATSTATSCGPPSGTITVSVPTGTAPFTYRLDGGAPQIVPSSTYTFLNVAAGPHSVFVTDASGVCNSTVPVTVTQNNNLTANITPVATSCPGVNNGSLTITPTIGTAPYTFTLNPGNIVRTGATASYTGLASGGYTITITDASGCTTSPALNATVPAGAGLTANTSQTATTCAGATNGTITVTPTNGTGPYTFLLDGVTTQTGATAVFTGLAAGSHTIRITDFNGCITNPNLTVNVLPGATLAANTTTTATSCNGAINGVITVTPTNGTGPYNFVLNPGAIVQTGATASYTGLVAGSYSVTVTDIPSGCISNVIPVNVTAGPALTTTATHTNVLCNGGASGSITVAVPASGTAPYEYSLDNATWQSSNIFNGLIAGTYTVYFRESNGCSGQLNRTITEPAVLNATANTVAALCNAQNNGTITVTSTGGTAPYEYSINGGTNWQSSNVFNVAANTYTVTIRDANLCTTTQTINVTEPLALTATAATTNASCNGGNDGTITVTASGGNASYEYSIDAGANWQSSNVFNVAPSNYTISVRDNLGCTYQFNTTVGLTNDLTFTPQVDPTICESKSTQLELVSNATQYAWSPATGLSSTTISNPVASPTSTTTYTVTATLGRCSVDDIVIVNVNPAPIPDAGVDAFICYGQTYTLQGSGGVQYTWIPSTYLNSTTGANPVSNPARTITYTLSNVIDANGCESLITDDIVVDVTPPIKVNTFPIDTIAHPGDTFQLSAIAEVATANIFTWSPSTRLSDASISNPVVTIGNIGDDIVYKVTAETTAGCKGEGYVNIRVYKGPELYVPTGFTPNNDGKNDTFYPFPVGIKSINYFKVFNRWGQLVFSSTRLLDGWDGKSNGAEQATGTYVWMAEGITKENKIITKKGTVVLIR